VTARDIPERERLRLPHELLVVTPIEPEDHHMPDVGPKRAETGQELVTGYPQAVDNCGPGRARPAAADLAALQAALEADRLPTAGRAFGHRVAAE
jgi:hypothetical protein